MFFTCEYFQSVGCTLEHHAILRAVPSCITCFVTPTQESVNAKASTQLSLIRTQDAGNVRNATKQNIRIELIRIFHLFTAKKLGEQCFYRQSCAYSDQYSSCIQVHHNAICQCKTGYHSVSLHRPKERVFCAEGNSTTSINYNFPNQLNNREIF